MKEESFPKWNEIHTLVFDFDGIFTDNKVYTDQFGNESISCNRADGLAFDLLRKFSRLKNWEINFFILSKESNPVVKARSKKLKVDCFNGINNKMDFLNNYMKINFKDPQKSKNGLVYMGNDLNDYECMKYAGFSVAPSDSHKIILEISDYIIPVKGGEGCVRFFIEELICLSKLDREEMTHLI